LFANLKNVKPGLSLNKDIQLRLNSEGDFYSSSLEQKLSRIYEADDYSVSANNTKPNVGGLCLVLSHKVNVGGIQNLFVAKCLSKLEVNKENVNHAEVSQDNPVKNVCQDIEGLDILISPVVDILNKHGFVTFESCQGGQGHCYSEPTVRFFGSEFDLIKAYELCQCYGVAVLEGKRVYRKEDIYKNNKSENQMPLGYAWGSPFNELTFVIHSKTGTTFLPD